METGNLSTVMKLYNSCPSGGSGANRLQVLIVNMGLSISFIRLYAIESSDQLKSSACVRVGVGIVLLGDSSLP